MIIGKLIPAGSGFGVVPGVEADFIGEGAPGGSVAVLRGRRTIRSRPGRGSGRVDDAGTRAFWRRRRVDRSGRRRTMSTSRRILDDHRSRRSSGRELAVSGGVGRTARPDQRPVDEPKIGLTSRGISLKVPACVRRKADIYVRFVPHMAGGAAAADFGRARY